jgi:hypothetical protein
LRFHFFDVYRAAMSVVEQRQLWGVLQSSGVGGVGELDRLIA